MAITIMENIDGLLKDHYAGPVRDQLNNEMMIFDLFNRRKMTWTGRKVIIPIRLDRNNSGGFRTEAATLPDAAHNSYDDLLITAKYLYGRMSLSGPAISQAKASQGAFLNALESELDGAKETVKNVADAMMFIGAGTVGFVSDQSVGAVADHPFSGNLEALPIAGGVAVNCKVVNTADFSVISTNTVTQSVNAGNITFGVAVDLAALPANGAASVVVENDTAGNPTLNSAAGIYSNLAGGPYATPEKHFEIDRNAAAGASLRSTVRALMPTGARSSIVTPKSLQFILDEIATASGEMPDCMISHYIFRQEYMGLLVQTVGAGLIGAAAFQKSTDNGDAGFTGGFSFNGIPLKVSRHCGKGLLIFLKTASWLITEVESPSLADLDGNVLSRVQSTDAYEAFVRYYYNLVCTNPNRNGILVGLSYAGV
tara:strand:+ start:129 stop:1406 length:1278 start_codon:yes stop_codon:yes gene_type:complete